MAATNHQRKRCAQKCNNQRTFRFPSSFAARLLATLAVVAHLGAPCTAAVHSVYTFSNASSQLGQLVTSSTLFWETYDPKDAQQLQYAVEGGKYITEDEHYPIYVCRVTIDGVSTSGHTEKIMQKHVCVAAHYKHGKYESFDVLVNKGHLGKIAWKHWRKFNAGVPVGAIRIGDDAYIGRHRAPHHQHNVQEAGEAHWGADYNLGRLDPVGLGKINVIENERVERNYDEGEVLVETEPFKYELRDIKLNKIKLDMRENITELATSILMNRGEKYSMVETVMSYNFDHIQYWGSHEGVARGLPTTIHEKDVNPPTVINWGLKHSQQRFETKSVHTKLWPGTALNVTLRGNYVTLEAPYSAKLFAFYYGSDESVSRKINAEVRKSYLKDVKLEFSPVYWIENGTFVPTTTTTSTTSTTTHATTTSTNEPTPMHEPPVVHVKDVGESHSGPDSLEKTLHDAPSHAHANANGNDISNEVPDNLRDEKSTALAGVGAPGNGAANTQSRDSLALLCTLVVVAAATLQL